MKKVYYNRELSKLILYHPYSPSFIEFVKSIPGKWYDGATRTWSIPNSRDLVNKFAELVSRFELELDESISKSVFCDFILKPEELNTSPIDLIQEEKDLLLELIKSRDCIRESRDYQLAGVSLMIDRMSVINGDDMGIGKTGQAILTTELTNSFPCFVTCPASVKYNWKLEWSKWFPDRCVTVIDDYSSDSLDTDVLIVNYDRLEKNKKWLKKILWKCFIGDESHYLKNNKSLRSIAARQIIKKIERRIFLTGTIVMNRPSELINQLLLLEVFDKLFGDWRKFVIRYCNGKKTRYGWDIDGASNLQELNMILRQSVYIRREKREVLHELPDIQYSNIEVEIDNMKDYREAKSNLIKYLKENFSAVTSMNAANAKQLVLMNTLRMLAGKGKLSSIYEFIDNFIEGSTRKLLVFGIHRDVIQPIVIKYSCQKIDGSTDPKKRLGIVNDFAINDERMLAGNIQSLGVGVDGLQDNCSDVLLVELPDRPSDIDQAVSRLERIGAKNAINVYILLAQTTIDMKLWGSLERKRRVIDGVNKGIEVDKNVSVMRDVLESYLKSL